jgi:hypothetical protein
MNTGAPLFEEQFQVLTALRAIHQIRRGGNFTDEEYNRAKFIEEDLQALYSSLCWRAAAKAGRAAEEGK